ncbi:MAG: AMP-binding protein [Deltaproteobacteria bacterium]|nr:AMP-binding protein [Deltaproteobacteria bacterium]
MGLDYRSYEEATEKFNWSERWTLFDGTKDNFNIAHECIDRHPQDDTAIRIKFSDGRTETYTFGYFSEYTCRFASYLESLGVNFGDRIAILLFPSIELYISMFGTFRRGAIATMLFPLFGPEAISFRLSKSEAKAIVTTKSMKNLIDTELAAKLDLEIIYADDLLEELKDHSTSYEWKTDVNTVCMMQFSSGTTGEPKSIMYRHGGISVAGIIMKLGNGLRPDDIYFCPSSPGWGHGIWYGTIAPLIHGRAIGTFSGKFDADKVLEAMEEWGVTIMAAISSHYRLIMESPNVERYKIKIRTVNYTGEAMAKDTIAALNRVWGVYPAVQYGTTEVGPIALDFMAFENWVVKPGSLGKPMIGGVRVGILDEDEKEVPVGTPGQVALWKNNAWIKVGDSAYRDEDGYLWYVGRIDDVIISAGYTIGPIEVEGAINKHPAVEECAVIGSPDKNRGDLVKAIIVLKEGYVSSKDLEEEIKTFVKTKLSKHEYPREIEFMNEIPKTPDGKIKRKLLKEREKKLKS